MEGITALLETIYNFIMDVYNKLKELFDSLTKKDETEEEAEG